MLLKDLGEFGLIARWKEQLQQTLPSGIEGIGDDCALMPSHENHSLLATTDLLIENTHFMRTKISAEDLGYKALAVNLSDIAAMGGQPLYAFLSLGLPPNISVEWTEQFFAGFKSLADQTHVLLLGGDTTRSSLLVINVLVIGNMKTAAIKRRSAARPHDLICCTGYLGDSGAGLQMLLHDLPLDDQAQALVQAHHRPRPHLAEGAWLAKQPGVHAMMDVSDGIDSDMRRIMEASHCGAHIQVESLPISATLRHLCQQRGWSAEDMALTAGEDYCLLLTVDPLHYSALQQAYQQHFQRPLFTIGTISDTSSLIYSFHNQPFKLKHSGFDHFKVH